MNNRISKNLLEKFDIEKVILTSPTEPFKPTSKADAVVVLEKSWGEINNQLVHDAWYHSILQYFQVSNKIFTENLYTISKLRDCGRFKDSDIEIIMNKEPKGFFYEKEILPQDYEDSCNIEEHMNTILYNF